MKATIAGLFLICLVFGSCTQKASKNKALHEWINNYILENEGDLPNTTYKISKIDLNESEVTFLIHVEGNDWCGTGGCPVWLVCKLNDGTFSLINDFTPIQEIRVSEHIKNHWKQLQITIGDGGSSENQTYSYSPEQQMYLLVE